MEGYAKVYEIMKSLKIEYADELSWVIPYPGNWHLLHTYQSPLMKAFFDAGLKHLTNVAGYPTAAIQNCSQFKRTHSFILEVWEALYRTMLDKFFSSRGGEEFYSTLKQIVDELLLLPNRDLPTNFNSSISRKANGLTECY